MKISLLAFGITKDILGARELTLELPEPASVDSLLAFLAARYPQFSDLQSLRVAVNSEYAPGNHSISPNDEIVLIPPVSGG
ncbi:MAG: MoaD/ThiS family protein [Bacteroidia bacterium]